MERWNNGVVRRAALAAFTLAVMLHASTAAAQNSLVLDPDVSSPSKDTTGVGVDQGRKGLRLRMAWKDAFGIPQPGGFPIDVSAATVTLLVNGVSKGPCANSASPPSPDACAFFKSTFDASGAIDTVKVIYNGDFPPNVVVVVGVTGVKSATNAVQNGSPDPTSVSFTTGTGSSRPPVSLELVVDVSGSMDYVIGTGTQKRIDALKSAAQAFFNILGAHARTGDKVGNVYFSTTATAFPAAPNLQPATDTTKMGQLRTHLLGQNPTNATSIGAGLDTANTSGFTADPSPDPNVKKSVILFSDGEQNTAPNVTASTTSLNVGSNPYPTGIAVCPITLGTISAPGFKLQQDIADARCNGENGHVEANNQLTVAEMETFFSQHLANILFGDKLETVKDVSGTVALGQDVQEIFLGNSDDVALSIVLSLDAPGSEGLFVLPFRLTAPDGTVIDLTGRVLGTPKSSVTTVRFPLTQNGTSVSPKGQWRLDLLGSQAPHKLTTAYHLIVIADNSRLASEFQSDTGDVGTGEPFHVRVNLSEAGTPVTGGTVIAQVSGPQNALGDLLATTPMPSGAVPPGGDVIRSEAQKKLLLLLEDPAFVGLLGKENLPTIVLVDDGSSGDAVANDGVYTATFPGGLKEGHYVFDVVAKATTAANGDYQRVHRLVRFVRPKPDPAHTDLSVVSSTTQSDGSVIIRVRAVPRDRFNRMIGPDYIGHMQITSANGSVVAPLTDHLDGSYETSFRLADSSVDPDLGLEVMGVPMAPPKSTGGSSAAAFRRFNVSVHVGGNVPMGSLSSTQNGSYSVAGDFEYRFTQMFSLEGYLGHDHFDGTGGASDFYVTHLSGLAKVRFLNGPLRPSLHIGLGPYFARGGDTLFGWNVGGSLEYWVTPEWAIEGRYDYRNAYGNPQDFSYSTLVGGVRYAF